MKVNNEKILIIDDDPGIGEMIKTLLEFKGYQAEVSDKPLQAKERILEFRADLVLLDVRLSGVDGTEVCTKLKRDEQTRDIPVLMMSALTKADKMCQEAGANGFISKPFEMDDLYKAIDNMLEEARTSS